MVRSNFFPHTKNITLKQIYDILDLSPPEVTDLSQTFNGLNSLSEASQSEIAVLHNPKYAKDAMHSSAGVCITTDALAHRVGPNCHVICHATPYRAYAKVANYMFASPELLSSMIHPTAVIHSTAIIGENCQIGPYVVIEEGVKIGARTIIEAHTHIASHVIIGDDGYVGSGVTISHSIIGSKVFIKPGTRIGQQGFGFHMDEKGHFDVPQLGIVEIANDVQIGSNVCIDRGSLKNTVICDGVRIDNLVQIAHNVYIGPMCVIVAQVGVAGSTRLGKFVVLAGQAGLAGHLNIGDHVKVAAQSGLMRDVDAGQTVAGTPAVPVRDWHKQTILLQKLLKENKDGAKHTGTSDTNNG